MNRTTMVKFAVYGLGFLVLNGAYLAAFPQASVLYMGNVLLHLALGLALMVAAIAMLRRWPVESGVFLLSGIPALLLVLRGNTMPHRWALWTHIGLAILAVAVVALRLIRTPAFRTYRQVSAIAVTVAIL